MVTWTLHIDLRWKKNLTCLLSYIIVQNNHPGNKTNTPTVLQYFNTNLLLFNFQLSLRCKTVPAEVWMKREQFRSVILYEIQVIVLLLTTVIIRKYHNLECDNWQVRIKYSREARNKINFFKKIFNIRL